MADRLRDVGSIEATIDALSVVDDPGVLGLADCAPAGEVARCRSSAAGRLRCGGGPPTAALQPR